MYGCKLILYLSLWNIISNTLKQNKGRFCISKNGDKKQENISTQIKKNSFIINKNDILEIITP